MHPHALAYQEFNGAVYYNVRLFSCDQNKNKHSEQVFQRVKYQAHEAVPGLNTALYRDIPLLSQLTELFYEICFCFVFCHDTLKVGLDILECV